MCTCRGPLRRSELARIAQMQPRASFLRFVREHRMRHAEPGREYLLVESGLLPHATARCFHRAVALQRRQLGQLLAHAARVGDGLSIVERRTVGNPEVHASSRADGAALGSSLSVTLRRCILVFDPAERGTTSENRPLDPLLTGRRCLSDAARRAGRGREMRGHVFTEMLKRNA